MAITNDTAALVAAQLTVAWSNIYATKPEARRPSGGELADQVATIYKRFLEQAAKAAADNAAAPYDMREI